MDVKDIKIVDGKVTDEKIIIFYLGDTMTTGYRLKRENLAGLYGQLRKIFKD